MFEKFVLLLSFCITMDFLPLASQWITEKSNTDKKLNSVVFSNNKGWIVGDNGIILLKENGEWRLFDEVTQENLYSVFMVDESCGWAVGAKGTIISYDGKNWKSVLSPTLQDLHSVFFANKSNGVAVGSLGTVLIYRDDKWEIVDFPVRANLHSVFFSDDDIWIGGGMECVSVPIFRMSYSENHSMLNTYESFSTISSIFFTDKSAGWAAGSPSILLNYNGNEWAPVQILDEHASLLSLHFKNADNGMCVGYEGTILLYKNGQWSKEQSPVNEDFFSCHVANNSYYAVGGNGIILKKQQSIDSDSILPDSFDSEIMEVYPNPCDKYLSLSIFGVENDVSYTFTITDLYGHIIIKEVLGVISDLNEEKINTNELANGMYFITLQVGKGKFKSLKFIVKH